MAEVRQVVKRKRGEWEVEEGRRVETGVVRRTIEQWKKKTVVGELVTELLTSIHANVDLDTKYRGRVDAAGKKKDLTGGRGSGSGEMGKGKEKERQRNVSPRRQDAQELWDAKERITSLEKQMWALMRHMKVQWDNRNQGIAPMDNRAPRRTTPPGGPAIARNQTWIAKPPPPALPHP